MPEFEFCRDHSHSFAALAGVRDFVDSELKSGATKQWVKALYVTDGFFETLGVNPELGRGFVRGETLPNGPYAAVLTDKLWRSAFRADRNIVGRQIVLDNRSYTVTGVLPPSFEFAEPADLFVSLHLGKSMEDMGTNTDVIGRLRPGVSLSQAQAEMPVLGKEFWTQASGFERQAEGYVHLDPYQRWLAGDYRMSLLMLLSAVGLLLLIACANVASLLLARANSRQKEISIRLALGATRGRLFAQFLTESLLLGVAGAAAGLAGAAAILRVFVSAIPWQLPAVDRIGLDGRVLFFTLLIGIGASIAFGLASFFQTRKVDLNSTLKDARTIAGVGRGRGRFLGALAVGEIAISLMLALGAGLLIESLYNLYQERLGFNPARIVLMETPFAPGTAPASHPWDFERLALQHIEAIPGVQSAAVVSVAPLNGQGNLPAQRDGHPEDSIGGTEYRAVSSGYFSTMGISILRGRAFQEGDFGSSASVALINETLARDWWPGQNPIGGRIIVGEFRGQKIPQILEPPREIIGVVADVKGMEIDRPAPPMVYVPASQAAGILNGSTDWVVRTSATAGIAGALRKAVTDAAPDQRIIDLEPMTQLISGSVSQPNFEALLMGMFGGLALL
ncbi:MAG TPA: ABC transporter permease, partial [Terracidiphilus sp.]|nr:ABC transporter permease [Terracidiphilus sp.]